MKCMEEFITRHNIISVIIKLRYKLLPMKTVIAQKALVTHIKHSKVAVLLIVTMETYFKCSWMARNLSTLIEVRIRTVADWKTACMDLKIFHISRIDPSDLISKIKNKVNNGWIRTPTPKSDTASPETSKFVGLCKIRVFQTAPRTKKFPKNAVNEHTIFRTQMTV